MKFLSENLFYLDFALNLQYTNSFLYPKDGQNYMNFSHNADLQTWSSEHIGG